MCFSAGSWCWQVIHYLLMSIVICPSCVRTETCHMPTSPLKWWVCNKNPLQLPCSDECMCHDKVTYMTCCHGKMTGVIFVSKFCLLVWFQDLGSSAGSKRPTCVILIKPHQDYQDAYNECMEEVSSLPKPLWGTDQSVSSSEVIRQLFKGAVWHFRRSFSSSQYNPDIFIMLFLHLINMWCVDQTGGANSLAVSPNL